jgi:ribonuclease HII
MDLLFDIDSQGDMLMFERLGYQMGFMKIAGIDEAGRGPLAGPVVAAAVVLREDHRIEGVDDSKKLTETVRNKLYDTIMDEALAVSVGVCDNLIIDRINILQATLKAMERAVTGLEVAPDYLLIDGISRTSLTIPQRTLKKGDSRSLSIAAASIVAKVTRDRMMIEYDCHYPGYGFAGHKGYGSMSHLEAIKLLGPCPIHRVTFRGVREHVPLYCQEGE